MISTESPAETITRSYADDFVKANADFRTQAGIEEFIVRRDDGDCCEWCAKLAGKFRYPVEVPRDVWRRHDNCGCTVEHISGGMSTNVHSKRQTVLTDEQREQIAQAELKRPTVFSPEESAKAEAEQLAKRRARLTGEAEGGIIKSITVKSFDDADPDKAVSDECRQVILDTLKSQGVSYVYDDVEIISIPRDKDGRIESLRTNAISRPRYPKVVLEVNEEALAGKSMEKINEMFALQNYSVAKSLEEAIIHESAHAKVIDGRSYEEYEEIDKELKGYKFTEPIASRADKKSLRDLAGEISEYAQKDGLECIAECHVKLSRGETIPAELKELHDRFIK